MKQENRRVPLGSLVQPQKAKAFGEKDSALPYLGLEHLAQGQPVLLGSAHSSDSVSVNSVFETGDILFGKLRPNLRKCAPAPFDGYCSTDILVLRARENIDADFAAYVLQSESVFEAAVQSAVGTKMPRTNWESLSAAPVFAPANRNEQQVIARILRMLDSAIQQTEALLAKQQRIKTGLMHDLLTRGLDAHGRIRNPSTHEFKPSTYGPIPKEWDVTAASTLCDAVIDCKNRTPPSSPSGHPVIRTPNVRNGLFVYEDLAHTDKDSYEIWVSRGKPRVGDVVITREAPFGEACQIPDDVPHACLGQRMMMYQPDVHRLRGDYMVYAIYSCAVQSRLLELAGGSTVGHVRVGDVRSLPIPHPRSTDEQEDICTVLNSLSAIDGQTIESLHKLRRLKSGLMHDLLRGVVLVTPLLSNFTA